MPSLMRFLTVVAVACALGFSAVYALATFVSPRTREMTVTIPPGKLRPPQAEAARLPKTAAGAAPAATNLP